MIGMEANATMEAVGGLAGGIAHDVNPRLEKRVEAGPVDMAWAGTLRGAETVLVVDDEAAVRSAVWEILQATGYLVLEAGSGGGSLADLHRAGRPHPPAVNRCGDARDGRS